MNNSMAINLIGYIKWTNSLIHTICQKSHEKKWPITIKEIELIFNNFPGIGISPKVRCSLVNSTKLLRKKLYQLSAISSKR